jgi:hypothetical protein
VIASIKAQKNKGSRLKYIPHTSCVISTATCVSLADIRQSAAIAPLSFQNAGRDLKAAEMLPCAKRTASATAPHRY